MIGFFLDKALIRPVSFDRLIITKWRNCVIMISYAKQTRPVPIAKHMYVTTCIGVAM